MKKCLKLLAAGSVVMLLSACAGGSFSCSIIRTYSGADQIRALQDLNSLPEESMLRVFADDYGIMRDQVRKVCS